MSARYANFKKAALKNWFRTSAKASASAALPEASKRATQWTFQPSHGAVVRHRNGTPSKLVLTL